MAVPLTPAGACNVVSDRFEVRWKDADDHEDGRITWYRTEALPPPFFPHERPPGLTGTEVAGPFVEADGANRFEWDVSALPTGNFWLWARTVDPPLYDMAATSLGPVTVVRPGDAPPPAIAVLQDHSEPETFADAQYVIRTMACDPDGTGRVRLEVTNRFGGEGLYLLADDLPAARDGEHVWDTAHREAGWWSIRATLTDGRGRTAEAWSRYPVVVYHGGSADVEPLPEPEDAGGPGRPDPWRTEPPKPAEPSCATGALEVRGWTGAWFPRR